MMGEGVGQLDIVLRKYKSKWAFGCMGFGSG